MKRALLIGLVALTAACTKGGATEPAPTTTQVAETTSTTTTTDPRPFWVRIGQQALAAYEAVDPDWRRTGYTITFHPGSECPGVDGRADFTAGRIDICVSPGSTVDDFTAVVAHEIGHVLDWLYLTDTERQEWKTVRGITLDDWWSTTSVRSDFDLPSGDWAEAWAHCTVPAVDYFEGRLADDPTPDQCTLARELVDQPTH